MADPVSIPPRRLPELVLSPLGNTGRYVVKNPRTGKYFQLGDEEHFLLQQLDGSRTAQAICDAFHERFHGTLSTEELDEFVEMARGRGLLESAGPPGAESRPAETPAADQDGLGTALDEPERDASGKSKQSILYWRISLFDPDRLFDRLEPHLRFLWTRGFLLISAAAILAAGLLVWVNRQELLSSFADKLSWKTVILAWITVIVATTCHEFSHGLTCKHHGGHVHEVGFLLVVFTPCFFCNISDAWLIPEKSKRLWVTFAGAYCDLCIWALAVFLWRLTVPDSLVNYLAFVALSICGGRMFFNLNPLLRVDGYYLLSDWLELPNLRRKAGDYWVRVLRWGLWGAPRPAVESHGKLLLVYGAVSWFFTLGFITAVLAGILHFRTEGFKWIGGALALFLGTLAVRRLFHDVTGGEVRKMVATRRKRLIVWSLILATVVLGLATISRQDWSSGTFLIRPRARIEFRSPVAGFLRAVEGDEGDRLSVGARLARMEVPDLTSTLAQKRAQVRESQANLKRLEAGPRKEEIAEQQLRVRRAQAWRDQAKSDLARSQQSLKEDLARLEQQIAQGQAEIDFAKLALANSEKLVRQAALAGEQYQAEKKRLQVAESQCEQAKAQRRSREAIGTLEAETELGKRERELADAQSALALLQAGTRPEEIEAERARLVRLQEDLNYAEQLRQQETINSPISGVVTTPRLREKIGQFFEKGAVIGVLEDTSQLEAELLLSEEELDRVKPGQTVELKARAFPFRKFHATVDRIAAAAVTTPDRKTTVTAYCRLEDPDSELRPGMTGTGRIDRGSRSIGSLLGNRALRLLRTEFWW